MTDKTKKQLRAEAVERLKELKPGVNSFSYSILGSRLYSNSDEKNRDWLIDLLTDEPTNGTADETNEICADSSLVDKLPEGDAAYLLRKLSMDFRSDVYKRDECDYLDSLADMVERDYVRRDDYDEMESSLIKAGRVAVEIEREIRKKAQTERDEWKAKAEGSSKVRAGSSNDGVKRSNDEVKRSKTNLEWLFENELGFRHIVGSVAKWMGLTYKYFPAEHWLLREHVDANGTRPDANGTCPIGEPCTESYMDTDAGQQSPSSREADSGEHVSFEGANVTCPDDSRTFADMSKSG